MTQQRVKGAASRKTDRRLFTADFNKAYSPVTLLLFLKKTKTKTKTTMLWVPGKRGTSGTWGTIEVPGWPGRGQVTYYRG